VELYGGSASAINAVPLDSTAFAKRDTLFTIQFVSASAAPPYPAAGFTFLDGMVASILNNEPADWNYGCVSCRVLNYYSFFHRISTYLNYIDDRLLNGLSRSSFLISSPSRSITYSYFISSELILRNTLPASQSPQGCAGPEGHVPVPCWCHCRLRNGKRFVNVCKCL
jgi:hypothetical protein